MNKKEKLTQIRVTGYTGEGREEELAYFASGEHLKNDPPDFGVVVEPEAEKEQTDASDPQQPKAQDK